MAPRARLPSGTVTFVFTDMEGSTKLLQRLGTVAYAAVLERHRELVRAGIAAGDGVEVGTDGDSFFVVFPSALGAVSAVVAAQRALDEEAWPDHLPVRVRVGLHTGEGHIGAAGTYVGLDVHRAARIAAAAHGGQVLLSGTTRGLVEADLPPAVSLLDLGEHRLKDLPRPEHLSQLVIDGLPDKFPPPRTIDATPTNLPRPTTSFIGREQETAEVRRLLGSSRLLTLTGPGGTGKTRLALAVAGEELERFPDGVYFVGLEPITEPRLISPTIARVLGIQDVGGEPIEQRLLEFLAPRRLLLVLDNFEQVVVGASTVADLLRVAPELRVIVTSRAVLRIYGEQEYPVPPLKVPDPTHLPALEALTAYEAVALFVARAAAASPDFAVTNENAPAVAQIAARLDGLPLAIELAAARVRLLSPETMLPRLESRLALLAGGSRDVPVRQRTLRGAIEWSHDLLDDGGRRLFARLAVFVGGFDLEAAEAICGPSTEGREQLDVLGILSDLVDQSLVRQADGQARVRLRMLETIREFASEHLAAGGEEREMRTRHAAYFAGLAERAEPHLVGEDRATWLDTLERDHDNLRAAIGWATETGDASTAHRLVAALWRFWQSRAFLGEGAMRTEAVLAMPAGGLAPELRARALEAAGGLAYWQGEMAKAKGFYGEALEIARASGDRRRIADALYNLSFPSTMSRSELRKGTRMIEEATAIYRELGDETGLTNGLWGLGNSYYFAEEWEQARLCFAEALEHARRSHNAFMIGWSLHMGGSAEIQLGRFRDAYDHLREALLAMVADRETTGIVLSLDDFSELASAVGDFPRSIRLAGAARKLEDETGTGLARLNNELTKRAVLPTGDLAPEEVERLRAEGRAMTTEEAVEVALGLPVARHGDGDLRAG